MWNRKIPENRLVEAVYIWIFPVILLTGSWAVTGNQLPTFAYACLVAISIVYLIIIGKPEIHASTYFFILFIVWTILTASASRMNDPFKGTIEYIIWVSFFLAATRIKPSRVFPALAFLLLGMSITIFYQYISGKPGSPFVEYLGTFSGNFDRPEAIALIFAVITPFLSARALSTEQPQWTVAIYMGLIVIAGMVLHLTGSLAAVIVSGACVLAVCIFAEAPVLRKFAVVAVFAVGIGISFMLPEPRLHVTVERMRTARAEGFTSSFKECTKAWKGALAAIKAHPVIGAGPGSFKVAVPAFQTDSYLPREACSIAFHVAVEAGAVGLLLFTVAFIGAVMAGIRARGHQRAAGISALGGFVVASLSPGYMAAPARFLLLFVLGLSLYRDEHQNRINRNIAWRVLFGVVGILTLLCFLSDVLGISSGRLLEGQQYRKAEKELKKTLLLNPWNAQARMILCKVYVRLRDGHRALECARRLVKRGPDDYAFNILLAQVEEGMRMWPEAVEHYRKSAAFAPWYVKAYIGMEQTLRAMRDIDGALKIMDTAAQNFAKASIKDSQWYVYLPVFFWHYGDLKALKHDYKGAIVEYTRAVYYLKQLEISQVRIYVDYNLKKVVEILKRRMAEISQMERLQKEKHR